jgi:hypothetical protein
VSLFDTLAVGVITAQTFAIVALVVLFWRNRMAAIDDLTTVVGAVEAASAGVVTEVTALKNSSDEAALTALTTRLRVVVTNLTALVPPPPAPASGA